MYKWKIPQQESKTIHGCWFDILEYKKLTEDVHSEEDYVSNRDFEAHLEFLENYI